jgi:hypothetical protein
VNNLFTAIPFNLLGPFHYLHDDERLAGFLFLFSKSWLRYPFHRPLASVLVIFSLAENVVETRHGREEDGADYG